MKVLNQPMRVWSSKASFYKSWLVAALLVFAVLPQRGSAETYPTRLIKLIVPYTAGSPNDVIARLLAPALAEHFKQPVIVENRAGAGGIIGTRAVATAEPDGYTLLLTDCINHTLAPVFFSNLSYDPTGSFVPISALAKSSWVLVANKSLPVNSLAEFISYAKAHPKELKFGFGLGTSPQIVGAFFMRDTKTEFMSVPYKGGAQAITDMLGDRINMNFGPPATLRSLIGASRIKALAVTSQARNPDLPDVPTMIESGFPDLTVAFTVGLFAPARTPPDILAAVNEAVKQAMNRPDIKATLAKIGFTSSVDSPEQFAALLHEIDEKWTPVAKGLGVHVN